MSKIETFKTKLSEFQKIEQDYASIKDENKDTRTALKTSGAAMAEALTEAIEANEATEEFFKALPEVSRTAQGYISKAKKVGKALAEKTLVREGRSVMRLYDILQEQAKENKALNEVASANNAKTYHAILAACDDDKAEANRIFADITSPEYIVTLQAGLAILAEREAQAEREAKAENMEKFVTQVKADIALVMESEFAHALASYVQSFAVRKAA